MYFLDIDQLDVAPENDGKRQMPDLVLKTGDIRMESEPAVVPELSDDEDSWPSESSEEFSEEPEMTSAHPPSSFYSNREDVVGGIQST